MKLAFSLLVSQIRAPTKQTMDHLSYNGLHVLVRYRKIKVGILLELILGFIGSLL